MATPNQVSYALALLEKAGYSTGHMNKTFLQLGATIYELKDKVPTWLYNLEQDRISALTFKLEKATGMIR